MKVPELNAGKKELHDWVLDCHRQIRNAWDEFPENQPPEKNPWLLKNDKKITIYLFLFHQNCTNYGLDRGNFEKNLNIPEVWQSFYFYNILAAFDDYENHHTKIDPYYFKVFATEDLQKIKNLISYMKKCIYTVLPSEENDQELFSILCSGKQLTFRI